MYRCEGFGVRGWGNSVMSEASRVVRFMKSFHGSCEIPFDKSLIFATETCELSRAQTFPQNANQEKNQKKLHNKTQTNTLTSANAARATVFKIPLSMPFKKQLKTHIPCCVCAYDKPAECLLQRLAIK